MKKHIITALKVAIPLIIQFSIFNSAFAQWAGKDQEIFRSPNNSQTVTLSVTNASPKACYKWTGPNIQGDANQPSVTANPQQPQQSYVCQRISAEGVEEDEVIVKVFDSVQIVSVTPKKKCYAMGDDVVTSDFDIVTEPTGYENQVTVTPAFLGGASLSYTNSLQNSDGTLKSILTFSLTVNNHTSTKKAEIVVIDPDMGLSPSLGCDIQTFVKNCKKIEELEKEVETTVKNMKKSVEAGNSALAGCVSLSPPEFSCGSFDISLFKWQCCNGVRSQVVPITWGGLTCQAGVSITVPFPIAALPGISFYLNAESKVNVGLTGCSFVLSHNKDCANTELTLGITATISGSAGICALSPSIISAQLGLEGQGSSSILWNVTNKTIKWRPLLLTGSVVGKATCIGLIQKQCKWTFLKIQIGG